MTNRLSLRFCQRWSLLLAVFCVLVLSVRLHLGGPGMSGNQWERAVPVGHRIRTTGCTVPQFDPFDPSLKLYIRRHLERDVLCHGKPKFLAIRNGSALILEDELEKHNVRPEHLLCFYKEIQRNQSATNPDTVVVYGNRQPLLIGEPFKPEFVYVECTTTQSPEETFYTQYLLNVVLKAHVEERCQKLISTTPHNLNFLMLGLDSVSYLNLDRHMPKTARFMRESLGAFELRGYTKIGENSNPNQHALLTGLTYAETRQYASEGFYDTLTSRIILQQYRERGYRTMFLEDWSSQGIFFRFANGFRRPPTDYYPRHAITAMENSSKWVTEDTTMPRCLGPTMVSEEILDYVALFTSRMRERNFFAFVWINEITHNSLNSAGYADETLRSRLELLHTSGALDNTVLVLLSDHGFRFGDSRSTYIGKFEDRQPFAIVAFPPWFLEQHPKAAAILRVNQFRLTTPFDVHATLVELLDYPSIERPETFYGRSLMHEIPEARTCADAHIGAHWCVCDVRSNVTVTSTLALAMANQLVSRINALVARATRKCAEYRLLLVMDVTALKETPTDRAQNTSHYWVTVKLSPGNAVFEGTLRVSGETMTVLNDISRNDRYTWMSQCAWDHWLEKYCYCLRTLQLQM